MSELPFESNWRRISCNRYLPTPDDNCLIKNETYFNCPYKSNHSSSIFYHQHVLYITWSSGTNDDNYNIYLSKLNANKKYWDEPILLTKTQGYNNLNNVMIHTNHKFTIFYNRHLPDANYTSIMKIESINGTDWSEPIEFDSTTGTFIKGKCIIDKDIIILPFYYNSQLVFKCGYYLSKDNGNTWDKHHLQHTDNLLEPIAIKIKTGQYQIYFRDINAKYVYMCNNIAESPTDWTKPFETNISNNNYGFDVIKTTDTEFNYMLMCCNRRISDKRTDKAPLSIYISYDNGTSWKYCRDLDPTMEHPYYVWKYGEFSYPSILETKPNCFHIVYTYNRKTIKHKIISLDWLYNTD
ncbi:MAG: hypothetical protein EBU92_14710 [Betaproteobacteria bacterium]|nr:hypothetical protein [Betaproteobacteria bacterium]